MQTILWGPYVAWHIIIGVRDMLPFFVYLYP